MFSALDASTPGAEVSASLAGRNPKRRYTCPLCGQPVIPKMGELRRWHFAHLAKTACDHAAESALHALVKSEIASALAGHRSVASVRCEVEVGRRRADVLVDLTSGSRFVVEVQRSDIDPAEADARTVDYASGGICVVWVIPFEPPTFAHDRAPSGTHGHIAPTRTEAALHAMGRGNVYFWTGGATVSAVHMEPAAYWHDGQALGGDGGTLSVCRPHVVKLKSYRRAYVSRPLHLVDDFAPARRHAFVCGGNLRGPYDLWADNIGSAWWVDHLEDAANELRDQCPHPQPLPPPKPLDRITPYRPHLSGACASRKCSQWPLHWGCCTHP